MGEIHTPQKPEVKTSPISDHVANERLPLSSGRTEVQFFSTSAMNTAVVAANWGVQRSHEEIAAMIKRDHGLDDSQTDDLLAQLENTGFCGPWGNAEGFSPNFEEERAVISMGIRRVLEAKGWHDGIDVLIVTSGFPRAEHVQHNAAEAIIAYAGIPFRQKHIYRNMYLACSGLGEAFGWAVRQEALRGARVLIVSYDAVSNQISQLSPDIADPFPSALFGNGAAFIGLEPGNPFTASYWEFDHVPDLNGSLAWIPTYDELLDDQQILQAREAQRALLVRPPSMLQNGRQVHMDGGAVARFFVQNVVDRLVRAKDFLPQHVHGVLYHPANRAIVQLIARKAARRDIPGVTFRWPQELSCNTVSSTAGLVFIDTLTHLDSAFQSGERPNLLGVFYGAGAVFSTGVIHTTGQWPPMRQEMNEGGLRWVPAVS